MLFVTCHTHDIYSKILSKLTKSVPKCLIYTHCFRARSLFIFGNLFFWTGMLHSSSSMSSYSISFSRTNRSSSIYLTPLPFSSTNARNLVEWAYTIVPDIRSNHHISQQNAQCTLYPGLFTAHYQKNNNHDDGERHTSKPTCMQLDTFHQTEGGSW